MVQISSGDIFDLRADVILNPVNCRGAMGAGLAVKFGSRYPKMLAEYKAMCQRNELKPGILYTFATGFFYPSYVINFPTKDTWWSHSKVEYLESGLAALRPLIDPKSPICLQYPHDPILMRAGPVQCVAVPALGAGLGGLDYKKVVAPLLLDFFSSLEGIQVYLLEPR